MIQNTYKENNNIEAPRPEFQFKLVCNLITHNSEDTVSMAINEIIQDRISWEQKEKQASDERLYSILSRCYNLFVEMKEATSEAKLLLNAFNRKYPNKTLGVKDSIHLMNKIVFVVFDDTKSKRINVYAKGLKIAFEQGIRPNRLIDHIVKAGGIDEMARCKEYPEFTRVELGNSAIYGPIIGTINECDLTEKNRSRQFNPSSYQHGRGVLFLARYDDETNTFPIYRVIQNTTAVNAAYACLSSSISEDEKKAMIADLYESVDDCDDDEDDDE